jgi:hypothetical protein
MGWVINAYYYFFYRLYIWYESSTFKWWSDAKAVLSICVLEIMLLYTAEGLLSVAYQEDLFGKKSVFIAVTVVIVVSNYFIFMHNESWRSHVKRFNKLSQKKNLIGGIIVWTIVVFVFVALVFMYYLLSQINWTK